MPRTLLDDLRENWPALLAFVLLTTLVEAFGAIWTVGAVEGWYRTLAKPAWTPPDWLFGPVWGALYLMMALAAWLIWVRRDLAGAGRALALFFLQLGLNLLWSLLFFRRESPLAGLVDIVLLSVAILATIAAFRKVRPLAAWLLLPYLVWVTFATALNFRIWQLNG